MVANTINNFRLFIAIVHFNHHLLQTFLQKILGYSVVRTSNNSPISNPVDIELSGLDFYEREPVFHPKETWKERQKWTRTNIQVD